MTDELPLPQELQHLIEKRSGPARRRKKRRTAAERRQCDLGPLGALESASDVTQIPVEESRKRVERRTTAAATRRKRPRRRSDAGQRE